MKRIPVTPRLDYREKIEALGFDFHGDYWREEAYYHFTAEETACLEEATNEAYHLYCEAAQFIIEDNPEFMERALNIPKEIGEVSFLMLQVVYLKLGKLGDFISYSYSYNYPSGSCLAKK